MLNPVTTRAEAQPTWMVRLRLEPGKEGRLPLTGDVESMVELMYRTEDVCSVAVVPLRSGLAVAIGLAAPDAHAALERARGLATCSARYARLGQTSVLDVHVTPEPAAAVA